MAASTISNPISPVRTYREFMARVSLAEHARDFARNAAVSLLSAGRSIGRNPGWIRFPYYHHVFDDERKGFARQLGYLRQFGEFISIGSAVKMLEGGDAIDGNYFCITFDDGFKNNLTNAVPILSDKGALAAFFLVTDMIGRDAEAEQEHLRRFYDHGRILMEFLDWQDCRNMIDAGMTIGSHTVNHARLAKLDEAGATGEMTISKNIIEEKLEIICEHFCAPFGVPARDFDPGRDPELARRCGYQSLLTTARGANRKGTTPFMIKRDHMLANWGAHQLRYFFSQ